MQRNGSASETKISNEVPLVKDGRQLELGVEFCIEMVITFYQLGRDVMGLPTSVPLGAGCWVVAMLISIRILWIFPLFASVPVWVKAGTSCVVLLIVGWIAFGTVREAYRKQKAGEQLSPDTKALLTMLGGLSSKMDSLQNQPPQAPPETTTVEFTKYELMRNSDAQKFFMSGFPTFVRLTYRPTESHPDSFRAANV